MKGLLDENPAISIRSAVKIAILLSLIGGIVLIARSQLVESSDLMATAVAIDFVVTIPLVYFLVIRRTTVPQISIVPVFLLSVLAAWVLVPDDGRFFLNAVIMYAVPAAELFVFAYLGYRVLRTRKAFLDEKAAGRDLMERLRGAFVKELKPPFVARAAAFELGVLIFAVFKWRAPKAAKFTYHRRNGAVTLLVVFLALLAVETAVVHLLLALWSSVAAWLATAMSFYLAIQMLAHLKALRLRPIELTDPELRLRCGILGDTVIMRKVIESAEPIVQTDDAVDGVDLVPLGGMSQPNVRLTLSEPTTLFGVYGSKRRGSIIRLCVDDPTGFVNALKP
ncbi:MAG TPA: hypothetical protein PKD26_04535 [Pyrinomonadaceae bacterium]|nr:hypothetical protein [Pyrinomonadaceae bacterium]